MGMTKLDQKLVMIYKLVAIRDHAASLSLFIGGYNHGRAAETLGVFAARVNGLAREVKEADPTSVKGKIGRLRLECETIICPAMIPPGRSHFLEEAMVLLGMIRNAEAYGSSE